MPESDDSPNLKSLIAKIRDNGAFKNDKLYYDRVSVSDDDVAEIADALRGNTRLRGFTLRRMEQVTDRGGIALAEALTGNPRLETLDLSNNAMTDASAEAWAKTIGGSKTLCNVNLAKNELTDIGYEKIFSAVRASQNPNLYDLWTFKTNPPDIKEILNANRRSAWNTAEQLIALPDRLSGDELRTLDTRLPAILVQARMQATSLKVDAEPETFTREYVEGLFEKLPKLPAKEENFAEAMFAADERGYAPLDNPRLWDSPEAAKRSLDSLPLDSTSLTKLTLRGSSILTAAAHAMPAKEFVAYFNDKGIRISDELLLDKGNRPTPLFRCLIEDHKAPALFTADNLSPSNTSGIQKAFAHLPDHQRSQVGLTRLIQEVKRAAPQKQGMGR